MKNEWCTNRTFEWVTEHEEHINVSRKLIVLNVLDTPSKMEIAGLAEILGECVLFRGRRVEGRRWGYT